MNWPVIIFIGICSCILMQVLIIRFSIRQHRHQQQSFEAHSHHLATHEKWLIGHGERLADLETRQ